MQSITSKFLIDSKAGRFDQSLNDPALAAARGRLCASMARQKLGQHFLNSPAWQNRILEKLPSAPGETWVEIGAGQGQLTQHLAKRSRRLIAIETDPLLAENLRKQVAAFPETWPNVEIAEGDVLSLDIGALVGASTGKPGESGVGDGRFRVYGNLPYYITSPILHHLFQWADRIDSIHIVIQLEVAERIAAKPGTRDYGYLSVACQYFARPQIALKIPPGAFRPPPKVQSALVAMTMPGQRSGLAVSRDAAFLRFVQACFAQKRKTLRNNLLAIAPDERIQRALADVGLPSDARAEALLLPQFADLMRNIEGRS
jgi:16S rRNA (adenine1518-N6/adenine1519-N6)-dimethyltransferase